MVGVTRNRLTTTDWETVNWTQKPKFHRDRLFGVRHTGLSTKYRLG